jgi:hypothetical protein
MTLETILKKLEDEILPDYENDPRLEEIATAILAMKNQWVVVMQIVIGHRPGFAFHSTWSGTAETVEQAQDLAARDLIEANEEEPVIDKNRHIFYVLTKRMVPYA